MSEFASKTLYCQDGASDKVYQIVLESNSTGTFNVTAKWGRRGGTLQSQTKLTGASIQAAMDQMEVLLAAKRKKGYKDLDLTKDIGKADKVLLLPLKKVSNIGAFPHKLDPPKVYEEESFVIVGNTSRRIKE